MREEWVGEGGRLAEERPGRYGLGCGDDRKQSAGKPTKRILVAEERISRGMVNLARLVAGPVNGGLRRGRDPAPVRLDVEQTMRFLRDHEEAQARRERAARLAPGRGNGRPVSVATNEEVREALIRALRAHGIRVRASFSSRENSREEAPPPGCTRLCSGADCRRQSAALPGEGRPEHSPGRQGEELQ